MIRLQLLDKNPLSLEPILAKELGIFEKNGVEVSYEMVTSFPAFDMTKVDANVGDTTRIFERLTAGEDLIITSDLTRTMKLMLRDDYKQFDKLKILASEDQSLGIYTEYYTKLHGIEFEYVIERNMKKRVELITSGAVDGACMIDPFLIDFIGNGFFLAYEGKEYPHNYTCWAFHRSFDNENPGQIKQFHKSLNEASDYWNNLTPEDKLKLAYKYLDVWPSLEDYYKSLEFNQDSEYTKEALDTCYEWKCLKTPSVSNLDLSGVIYKW